MWVFDQEKHKIVERELFFVPALYKIFDEILVNAVDNKRRDKLTSYIKIDVDKIENKISICNDGCGVPVIVHSTEGMYIPTLIFGHLLTSSNYDDSIEKTVGGRNGFGAKLCNLFSKKFIVETSSKISGYSFKQTWTNNMQEISEPIIAPASNSDFTKITFYPDLSRFDMNSLNSNIISLFHRRAFDVASCLTNVSVYFNDSKIPVETFKDYVQLYQNDDSTFVHNSSNKSMEVAVCVSPNHSFNHISFVNGIYTRNGGQHVDYFTNKLIAMLMNVVRTVFKNDADLIRPNQIKNLLWIFMNTIVRNPTFESQSKECLTFLPDEFQSNIKITDQFVNEVANCGLMDKIEAIIEVKKKSMDSKYSKSRKLKVGIAKLDDAIFAGTKFSQNCTLILTEGDSAKSLALGGLSILGRDHYGIYPLRGKSLNVRDLDELTMSKNQEFSNLINILGLKYQRNYHTEESLKSLRYGKVMIMADQDPDGSHIKGLILNFFHYNWPELLQHQFLQQFITPIIKATRGRTILSFYSIPEYNQWERSTPDVNQWYIKYYKGLGTSTNKEAKEYFSNIEHNRKSFHYSGPEDDILLKMAFDKLQCENRKTWLLNWMNSNSKRADRDLNEGHIYHKNIKSISYSDFVNKELVIFSNMDNERSIPSLVDGLKPAQRKVIYTCLKRNITKDIKVSQLAGSVAELTSYHHGEEALHDTITGLAQDFVGSNNINLLVPNGQFGTRIYGGKDKASSRYIHTKLSPITKYIFHPDDEHILTHLYDNNQMIEPKWYIPVIPMVLVNGCDGVGTGWKSSIPNYNPLDIIKNMRLLISGQNPVPMLPWFRNFKGTIEELAPQKYLSTGKFDKIGPRVLEITELPIRMWTHHFKENVLNSFLNVKNGLIEEYENHSTDTDVKFLVHTKKNTNKNNQIMQKIDYYTVLKLKKLFSTNQMVLFDENGQIFKFKTPEEILLRFYHLRLPLYGKRKANIETMLGAESLKWQNQARFIQDYIEGRIPLLNIKEDDVIALLLKLNYEMDPLKVCNEKSMEQKELKNTTQPESKSLNHKNGFNYLLSMPLKNLTKDNFESISQTSQAKLEKLTKMQQKRPEDLWLEDLENLENKLQEMCD